MDVKATREGVDSINLVQGCNSCEKVNETSASINAGNFLTKDILASQLVTLLDY